MSRPLLPQIVSALARHAPHAAGSEPHLQAAIAQVVAHPGKLLRAQLIATAARRHGLKAQSALGLACGIEYFHAASLVLDDLPCMDDATLRRSLPCVHRQHGEATAILTALALINRAYALIANSLDDQPRRVRREANDCLDRCLGVTGIVGGQAWDLRFSDTGRSPREVGRIAAAKTGALFEIAILLPALLARPTRHERRLLRALSVYWGQMFQITDDLRDVMSCSFTTGKTTARDQPLARPNLVLVLGLPSARRRLTRLHAQSVRTLAALTENTGRRWDYLHEAAGWFARATAMPFENQSAAA